MGESEGEGAGEVFLDEVLTLGCVVSLRIEDTEPSRVVERRFLDFGARVGGALVSYESKDPKELCLPLDMRWGNRNVSVERLLVGL